MDEQTFRKTLSDRGYEAPEFVEREANLTNEPHTHDFTACALVLEGTVSVITDDGTTTCHAGDTFELPGGTTHREHYGPEGARFLLGRKTV